MNQSRHTGVDVPSVEHLGATLRRAVIFHTSAIFGDVEWPVACKRRAPVGLGQIHTD